MFSLIILIIIFVLVENISQFSNLNGKYFPYT